MFDTENGYVMAPMARGLRITTGAELTGRDAPATPLQLERAERAARQLIDLGSSVDPEPSFGTRPFLADMLPVIGEAFRTIRASGSISATAIRVLRWDRHRDGCWPSWSGSTPVIDPAPFDRVERR